MNTIQLECFVTAAEHLSFSKASQVLKITQPAVSHQIQSLEEELDVKLLTAQEGMCRLRRRASCSLPTRGLS